MAGPFNPQQYGSSYPQDLLYPQQPYSYYPQQYGPYQPQEKPLTVRKMLLIGIIVIIVIMAFARLVLTKMRVKPRPFRAGVRHKYTY